MCQYSLSVWTERYVGKDRVGKEHYEMYDLVCRYSEYELLQDRDAAGLEKAQVGHCRKVKCEQQYCHMSSFRRFHLYSACISLSFL